MANFSFKKILISLLIAVIFVAAWFVFYKRFERQVLAPDAGPTTQFLSAVGLSVNAYLSPRAGFSLHPPSGWQIDESGQLGTFVVFVEPVGDEESGTTFNANINVIDEKKPADTLEDYVRATKVALPKILSGFKVTDSRKVALRNDLDGHLIAGEFSYNGVLLNTVRLLVIDKGRGYAVTATALASTWEGREKSIIASLLTFRP